MALSTSVIFSKTLKKYLIYLSYIGTDFRGMQKQKETMVNGKLTHAESVQETLEKTIASLFNLQHDVNVYTSSRTDAGVHALRTSVHVHLQRERNIPPDIITMALNKYFVRYSIGIRIQSTQIVPVHFSARKHAISRTYLYRLAFRKKPMDEKEPKYLQPLPMTEFQRTHFEPIHLDVEKMKEAAQLLVGTKDFFSFMGKPTHKTKCLSTFRTIDKLDLVPSRPFFPEADPGSDVYEYWNVVCTGQSFLYRQVRRMVGALIAVGNGSLTMADVQLLIDKPGLDSWNPRAVCVPPWGLYLMDVKYNPLELMDPSSLPESENSRATFALY